MAHSSRHKPRRHRMHTPRRPGGAWANGPIPVIGLVGGIGAGKSLAAAALAERGVRVLDADAVGHALLAQRPARERVVARFGLGVLRADEEGVEGSEPEVDRAVLGRIVFADPVARRDLEAILHPAMRKTFERAIARAARAGLPGVVLDAAILYEAGWDRLCDAVLFIDAPRDARLARLAAARGWSAEHLDAREAAQAPLDSKRERADCVVENADSPEALREAVLAWWSSFVPARPSRGRAPRPG
ncbi:MAG TPA: dephospho-CoA kinase [Isosphaeraceae bacterium]